MAVAAPLMLLLLLTVMLTALLLLRLLLGEHLQVLYLQLVPVYEVPQGRLPGTAVVVAAAAAVLLMHQVLSHCCQLRLDLQQ
jgi:uncharacterized SAM-binding protein YcdF (DUF218 family)